MRGRRCVDHENARARIWLGGAVCLLAGAACWRRVPEPPPLTAALVEVPGPRPQIAASMTFSCLLSRDGHVICWGDNALGQLGEKARGKSEHCIGEQYEEEVEFPGRCDSEPRVVPGLDDVRQLAVGHDHACALRGDGSVWCWGGNWQGQLGLGKDPRVTPACRDDVACARIPLPVPGIRARSIAAGADSSCAVLESGQVACWGDASSAQISKARDICTASYLACALTPVVIDGVADVSQVAVGGGHVCALRKDGRIFCWGANDHAEVGVSRAGNELCHREYPCVRQPTLVPGVRARQVIAGGFHTCALESDGHVKCWGRDDRGQLGAPSADEKCGPPIFETYPGFEKYPCASTPRTVQGLEHVARLAPGGLCAIVDGGRLFCWGSDVYGELGIGGATGRCRVNGMFELPCSRSAVAVADAGTVVAVASSGRHVCSVGGDDRVFCWGANDLAQAGPPSKPIDLCVHIPPDQKTPCLRRPRELAVAARP